MSECLNPSFGDLAAQRHFSERSEFLKTLYQLKVFGFKVEYIPSQCCTYCSQVEYTNLRKNFKPIHMRICCTLYIRCTYMTKITLSLHSFTLLLVLLQQIFTTNVAVLYYKKLYINKNNTKIIITINIQRKSSQITSCKELPCSQQECTN